MSNEKWNTYSKEELTKFAHLVPEFIIELKSQSDHISQLHSKMVEWMENGVLLGWLIDLDKEEVFVYTRSAKYVKILGFDQKLSGEPVLKNFKMDLSELRIQ